MPRLEGQFSKGLENYSESETQDPVHILDCKTNNSSFPLIVWFLVFCQKIISAISFPGCSAVVKGFILRVTVFLILLLGGTSFPV